MADYTQKYIHQAIQLAQQGKWDDALHLAKQVPAKTGIFEHLAHSGIPEEHGKQILEHLAKDPKHLAGFVKEHSYSLPKNATSEYLNKLALAGKDDAYSLENILFHPNYKPSADLKNEQAAASFWRDYEQAVKPDHFATIKSLISGKPEKITDHRGDEGTSETYKSVLPHLNDHAKAVQQEVLKDASQGHLSVKYVDGKPHVKVYRGVGGNYSQALLQTAEHNPETNEVANKTLSLPASPLESWSTDRSVAKRFAEGRANWLGGTPVVMENWMPVEDILHSGSHNIYPGQPHAHPYESELVFQRKDGRSKIPSKALHLVDADSKLQKVKVPKPVKQPEQVQKSEVLEKKDAGFDNYNSTPEQKELAGSVDLSNQLKKPKFASEGVNDHSTVWTSLPNGGMAIAKKADPEKEVAYHNLARDFFGLGHYVPPTALHMAKDGNFYSVQKVVPHAQHAEWDENNYTKDPHASYLADLDDKGELDKITLMDAILGNHDRFEHNFVFGGDDQKNPKLHLIDHGLAFSYPETPEHRTNWSGMAAESLNMYPEKPLHPEAVKWLASLNPSKLHSELDKYGIAPHAGPEAAHRLKSIQQDALTYPGASKMVVLDSIANKDHENA